MMEIETRREQPKSPRVSMSRIPVVASFGPVIGRPNVRLNWHRSDLPQVLRMPYLIRMTRRSGATCPGVTGRPSIS